MSYKQVATYAKITTIDGILSVESDGWVAAIEINFTGNIKSKDLTTEGCNIMSYNNKIIIFMMEHKKMPEQIFSYEGEFIIENAKASNWDAQYIDVEIVPQIVDFSEQIDSKFETMGDPEIYKNDYVVGMKQDKTSFVKENLYTSGGQYYYNDGSEYVGEYHLHGNFQAMTGSTHSDDAINIYLKDGNDRLFKPNDKKYQKAIKRRLRRKNG